MTRASGILMHISSLPSSFGIGAMGNSARGFADFLKAAGQRYWQVLPLGPTGHGDSPYQSFSMYAGNPYFIDLGELSRQGLLARRELEAVDWGGPAVDYGKIYENRGFFLREAMHNAPRAMQGDVEVFRGVNRGWLEDYALFMALKRHFGMRPWQEWEHEGLRRRERADISRYSDLLRDEIDFIVFTQYLFWTQWTQLREYANALGIKIIGDIPIYSSLDSCDVWAHPEYYELDENRRPVNVAGVPPDYFSEDGQLWGNPLYNWQKIREEGYKYWINRMRAAALAFDVVRIDHFRGLSSYWSVNSGEATAKNGRWLSGPGEELVDAVKNCVANLPIIAEDLGILTPDVGKLMEYSGFPGMKVLEFAFDASGGSSYLPHNYERSCVCYTGTHDNTTAAGWAAELGEDDLRFALAYTGAPSREQLPRALLRMGSSSVADLFIAQMQDWLALPGECRMNTPGMAEGNWRWRAGVSDFTPELAEEIRAMTSMFGR